MLLDDLIDKLKSGKCSYHGTELTIKEFIKFGIAAERFDFGDLPLEPYDGEETKLKGVFYAPKVTNDELEFWFEGLIPVPSPVSWYEFVVNGIRSGLMIVQTEGTTYTQRVEFDRGSKTKRAEALIDGVWAELTSDRNVTLSATDPQVKALLRKGNLKDADLNYGIDPYLTIYMSLMINSQTTDVRKVKADPESNRLRRQRGKITLKDHTVITIVPNKWIEHVQAEGGPDESREVRHRRLHWRRSHRRVYHRGEANEYVKIIPRFLVGRRDLGEVTHEYRVRNPS